MINNVLPIILGILGLLSAYFVYLKVKASPEGTGKVKEIGDEIHLGAMVFMASEYKRLALFCVVCIAALYFSLGWQTAISFFVGAACSGVAGFIGMYTATKANERTAVAASVVWGGPRKFALSSSPSRRPPPWRPGAAAPPRTRRFSPRR